MRIEVPKDALVVMIGPAGSGKSTFAINHFGEDNVVSSDRCRYMVCGDETRQDINFQAFRLFHTWIDLRLACGVLTVADATNVQTTPRKELRGRAMKYNRPVIAILIDVPVEKIHIQNRNRDRTVPDHVVDKHHNNYLQTKKNVPNETFDAYYIVTQNDDITVEILD